jgi:hypothetical protein
MNDFDRSNIDAMHWAEQFIQHRIDNGWSLEAIDVDLMLGWFANYRFAVADPLTAKVDELEAENQLKWQEGFDVANGALGLMTDKRITELEEVIRQSKTDGDYKKEASHFRNKFYDEQTTNAELEAELKHAKHMADKEYHRNMDTQDENEKLKAALQYAHDDLMLRAEIDPNGGKVVAVGMGCWIKIKAALDGGG